MNEDNRGSTLQRILKIRETRKTGEIKKKLDVDELYPKLFTQRNHYIAAAALVFCIYGIIAILLRM